MRVTVIGSGYVGLVTAVVFADLGNEVIAVETDRIKLAALQSGESPLYEPGLEERLRQGLASGHLRFTADLAEAAPGSEIVFIAVGTPAGPDGWPDLSAVRQVAAQLGPLLTGSVVIVNKSTVPLGSAGLVADWLVEHGADPATFDVVSNPEFLREGTAIHDFMNPDRIVIGAHRREAAVRLRDLYAPLNAPVHITDPASAELIKYASNSFLALKISFINTISRVCEAAGANVDDVARGMGADRRIGAEFLRAGLGWGGSCFPKDLSALMQMSAKQGVDFALLREALAVNDTQLIRALDRLERTLGGFSGRCIGLMGLAFKPNTDDIRDARSLQIIAHLHARGATVRAYDPAAMPAVREQFPEVEYVSGVYELSPGADALMVVTEWNEFRQLNLRRLAAPMRTRVLFDGRRIYRAAAAEAAGLTYLAVGSPDPSVSHGAEGRVPPVRA